MKKNLEIQYLNMKLNEATYQLHIKQNEIDELISKFKTKEDTYIEIIMMLRAVLQEFMERCVGCDKYVKKQI